MHIYSTQIFQFISQLKKLIKEILANEMGLKVNRERFFDSKCLASYPIHVVVFNNKRFLGYFDADFFELGFHESLMHASKDTLKNVIRHEIAHYIAFIDYGPSIDSHGPEFRKICIKAGYGPEVYLSTFEIAEENAPFSNAELTVLRRVKKLMQLAESANAFEAELAVIKSRELLLKHNLESSRIHINDEEQTIVKKIMKQKKEDAKMRAIAKILGTFFVFTVYCKTSAYTCLKILGSSINVEIAEYVAEVLQNELEHLWQKAQNTAFLKGLKAKNSFFTGIAKGYCDKVNALKIHCMAGEKQALMVIEKKLEEAKNKVFPTLSKSRSNAGLCQASSKLGEKMGRELNIKPALRQSATHSLLELVW